MRIPSLPRRLTFSGAAAISALVGLFCAFLSVHTISFLPPKASPRHVEVGVAATHVMVDAPKSLIVEPTAISSDFGAYTARASLYANLIASPPVLERIGQRSGIAPAAIGAMSRVTEGVERVLREPDFATRANQILTSRKLYRLELQADPELPIVNIYAQAPSQPEAVRLANGAVDGLKDYLDARAASRGTSADKLATVTQLGRARGSVINGQTKREIIVLTFLVAFGVALGLLMGARGVWRGWVASGAAEGPTPTPAPAPSPAPAQVAPAHAAHEFQRVRRGPPTRPRVAHARRRTPRTPRETMRSLVNAGGDWPRTTRVMPWLIAGFMVILWLVPFNVIQLTASLPFDLKFDRLVLPFLFGLWILSLAAGGPAAPRVRLTLIHVGIAGFVAVTCLGIVIDAHYLNQTLEFDLAVKKLTLLLSYALLFVIVASSVRRNEVPAFFKYNLVLAVLCAIGTIWEYRFHYNVFYDLSNRLLPGIFQVGAAESGQVDDLGRLLTRGPAEHPLETVGMISMALPIALVGIVHTKERRNRILYGLAASILLAAAISTYRKSALLAPVSVGLTIAYFRRRELLRLAPLAAVSVVVIHVLSPGALGSIVFQLQPGRLGVGTVSDRTADYDAVRPDVWAHFLFGRGYGSYDHVSYRVLDSEVLSRLVDTGVLGLLSLVLMLVFIVAAARGTIRARDPVWAPLALAVAAAAVAFLVLAFLFDVTSFPHTPYILLSLAGLLAVIISDPESEAPTRAPAEHHVERPVRDAPPPRRPTLVDAGRRR